MRIEYIALPVRDAACIEAIEYADDPDWPCINQLPVVEQLMSQGFRTVVSSLDAPPRPYTTHLRWADQSGAEIDVYIYTHYCVLEHTTQGEGDHFDAIMEAIYAFDDNGLHVWNQMGSDWISEP